MEYRVNSAFNAHAENKKLLTNKSIRLHTRILFLNTLVRSRLVYGCHAWRPTSSELSKINAAYNYMLRSMMHDGHTRVNPPPPQLDSSDAYSCSNEDPLDGTLYDWSYILNNQEPYETAQPTSISEYYENQQT